MSHTYPELSHYSTLKLNIDWHSVTICISLVLNNFLKNRLIEKSSDLCVHHRVTMYTIQYVARVRLQQPRLVCYASQYWSEQRLLVEQAHQRLVNWLQLKITTVGRNCECPFIYSSILFEPDTSSKDQKSVATITKFCLLFQIYVQDKLFNAKIIT